MIAKRVVPIGVMAGLLAALGWSSLQARTWTDAATGRTLEGEMVSANATSVVVATKDGRRLTLPLERLTEDDRAFVVNGKKGAPAAAKPAKPMEDRFDDVPKLKAEEIPMSGKEEKQLAAVDEAIRKFMAERGVPAVTFAVSKNGKVLHDRAYGWADADLKEPLQPGVKMRVASMTKPVVAAAILTLVDGGKLKKDDRVFDVLELGQYKEAKDSDARFKKVTIDHLLEHKGGWDRDKSGDFTFSTEIADMFRLKSNEVEAMHVVRYGLTRPMDFEPGEREAYCNFGYILLVRVVEKVSGKKFVEYLQDTVAKESKAPSFSASTSDARDRQAGEIWYCYHPEYERKTVPLTFRTEARDGAGGLACTAADYCRFLEAYWINGKPRTQENYRYSFNGSHSGVTAVCAQRGDKINYAAIANRRGEGGAEWNAELRAAIDAALDLVAGKL